MTASHGCGDARMFDAVMAVHSAPLNFEKRKAFRWLYTDQKKTFPYKIKVIFFLGQVLDSALQSRLQAENWQFGDTVQGSFIDSYFNLTYKAIFGFHWVNSFCKDLKLLLRIDDDVFFLVQNFFHLWNSSERISTIMCDIVKNDTVKRKGKWAVSISAFAETRYAFDRCLGYFVAISSDLISNVTQAALTTQFFWIDDVFMFGFVPLKVGKIQIMTIRQISYRTNLGGFEQCFKLRGRQCPHWMAIVNHTKFKQIYQLL
ncbi:lactosylceramide 1,3-N-acetyl-beta-D-glucosaminyltransferase-like isoform X2 [Physella acuta]|nr:lactosylceramide 1,3-N-acetyl-beta-D-glucosaminyltransferase-like isoform X2 [Physella acuta]